MIEVNKSQLQNWDVNIIANPDGGNPLQVKAFADTKAKHGWEPKFFRTKGKFPIHFIALSRFVPGIGEYWYIPKGPGVVNVDQLDQVLDEIKRSDNKPFAVRVDPEILAECLTASDIKRLGIEPSPRNIQYNVSTVAVRLDDSEDVILGSFKQKTRYNVRLALKKGVEVETVEVDQESIDIMYGLTEAMTARAGVYLRDKSYFSDFWTLHSKAGVGQMFFAKYEGKVLAGAFVTYVGKKALYKDGGSLRDHPEVQAPYALQWGIIRWLKSKGIMEYDLHGVPPANQVDDPTHPLAGLARFKTGFSKEVVEYIGTYDLPLNRNRYLAWRHLGERLAVAYEYRARNRLFY